MTLDEAKNKMDFLKKAYQKLIDEKVDSGKLVGDGVSGEWKAETPLDEAYKNIIEALELAIKALEQARPKGKWKRISPAKIYECTNCKQMVMTEDIDCYKYCHQCGANMRGENE